MSQVISGRQEHGWADQVARLVREQFEVVLGGTTYSRRKVLAGVVLDWEGKTTVVCVATGTKCISGEQLCLAGSVLNDCHAEVVARFAPSSGLLACSLLTYWPGAARWPGSTTSWPCP